MPNLAYRSLSNRRLLAVFAIGALLAATALLRDTALPGAAASPKPQVVLANCTSANINRFQAEPVPPVTTMSVTFLASSTGCVSPEYRYLLLAPGSSTWVFKTGYTTYTNYTWFTAGAAVGVWQVGVWARESGSTARYNAYAISSIVVGYDYCSGAQITTNPLPPQAAGQSVNVYGVALGCQFPQIEFWKMAPGSSTWVQFQPYVLAAQGTTTVMITWDTTAAAKGPWRWAVWVKSEHSPHRYDSYAMLTFWVT
jgi:hypothetical protein